MTTSTLEHTDSPPQVKADNTSKTIKDKALELLPALKEELGSDAEGVSDTQLLKFLYWKQDVGRASDRFRHHLQWRKEHSYAFDDIPLFASQDPELKRILESEVIVAPDGLVCKEGSTVVIGRLRNNDMTDGRTAISVARMFFYTIDRILERDSTKFQGMTIFHDLSGLSRKNVDPAIPKLVFKGVFGTFPIHIKAVYIMNPPWFFHSLFKIVSLMWPKKLRSRVHFVDGIEDVYKVIDQDSLLEEHGGKRVHDPVKWVETQMEKEESGSVDSLYYCLPGKKTKE